MPEIPPWAGAGDTIGFGYNVLELLMLYDNYLYVYLYHLDQQPSIEVTQPSNVLGSGWRKGLGYSYGSGNVVNPQCMPEPGVSDHENLDV